MRSRIASCFPIAAACGLLAATLPALAAPGAPPPSTQAEKRLEVRLDAAYGVILRSRFDAARKILEPLVTEHPASGKAEFMLGLSYHQQRRYRQALPHFQRAVKLDPEYHQTRHFLGYCLYYLGDTEEAGRAFEKFLEHSPNNPHTHFALGLVAYEDDRLEEAEARFVRAIELCEGDPSLTQRCASAHTRLADVYIRSRTLEPARCHLETALRLNPALSGAHFKLSRVLAGLGEHDASTLAYRRFLKTRAKSRSAKGAGA